MKVTPYGMNMGYNNNVKRRSLSDWGLSDCEQLFLVALKTEPQLDMSSERNKKKVSLGIRKFIDCKGFESLIPLRKTVVTSLEIQEIW